MRVHSMFINLINISPADKKSALDAVQYIIEEGTGGRHLDEIHKKNFRVSSEEYYNRLVKIIDETPSSWTHVYDALVEWHETFSEEYHSLTMGMLKARDADRPIHTWVHCLLDGELHRLRTIRDEELILVDQQGWDELLRTSKKASRVSSTKKENHEEKEPLPDNLSKLFEVDMETRLKAWLFGKSIALFLLDEFDEENIERYIKKYHLKKITQYSSLSPNSFSLNHGLYVFLGKRASHSAFHKLNSQVSREKIIQVSGQNIDIVFEEITTQLKGQMKP